MNSAKITQNTNFSCRPKLTENQYCKMKSTNTHICKLFVTYNGASVSSRLIEIAQLKENTSTFST